MAGTSARIAAMDLRTFSHDTDVDEGESPASFGMIFLDVLIRHSLDAGCRRPILLRIVASGKPLTARTSWRGHPRQAC
jgi:hypothetical protein